MSFYRHIVDKELSTTLLVLLELLQGARPVFVQQPRQRPVGEQTATGLAWRAVVGLVGGIADALHLRTASRTRLAIAPMHRHLGTKRCYFFGESVSGLDTQS